MKVIFAAVRMLERHPVLRLTYTDGLSEVEQQMKEFDVVVRHHPYLQILSMPQDSR
jgi:hypothetical protein